MEYLAVQWKHNFPDMPVEIFSEIDGSRMETRKVEVFPDKTLGFASALSSRASTKLGIEPLPSFGEIASQTEFSPRVSTKQEFEKLWTLANQKGRL